MTGVRARRCPNCTGLLSETITGELDDPDMPVTCLECGRVSAARLWVLGEWTPSNLDEGGPGGAIIDRGAS